jgi:allantoicase
VICNNEQQTQESGQSLAFNKHDRLGLAVMVVTDPFVAPLEELLHELGVIDQLHDVAVEQHDATWSGVLPTEGKEQGC